MKLLFSAGAIALMCSGLLVANGIEENDLIAIPSETVSLPDLLIHIQNISQQLNFAGNTDFWFAYQELQESLMVLYILHCLHPEETRTIQKTLDECYLNLAETVEQIPSSGTLKTILTLFSSADYYEQKAATAEPLETWSESTASDELKAIIQTTDADLIYVQDGIETNVSYPYPKSHLLYRKNPLAGGTAKVMIVKNRSNDSSDYKVEGRAGIKLGGKDHGKFFGTVEGQVKDKNGNYAGGKVSKEQGSDSYDCEIKAGKEKKKK